MTKLARQLRPFLVLPAALVALCPPAAQAAGNVTVTVDSGGNLIVEGDHEDNAIWISPVEDGVGDVVGLDGTLVNGADRAAFVAPGDFRFRMFNGDDRVEIDDGDGNEILDDLDVDLGPGDDHLLIRYFFVNDDLVVSAGPGDDTIELDQNVFVLGDTDIETGSGDDQVLFEGSDVSVPLVVFEGDFSLSTGPGIDFVDVIRTLFEEDVQVDLGPGDDNGDLGGPPGGLCLCEAEFEAPDVLNQVSFDGSSGHDAAVMESVEGIAPPGVVDDYLSGIEFEPDDCSYLGGEAC